MKKKFKGYKFTVKYVTKNIVCEEMFQTLKEAKDRCKNLGFELGRDQVFIYKAIYEFINK